MLEYDRPVELSSTMRSYTRNCITHQISPMCSGVCRAMLTMVSSKNTEAGSYGSAYVEDWDAPIFEVMSSDSSLSRATVRS